MRTKTIFKALVLATASIISLLPAQARKVPHGKAEDEVRELLTQLREAQLRHDRAALERLYAEDYTLTEDDGSIFTKEQRIAAIGKLQFASSEIGDVRVRIYNGDTAVLNYRATVRFRSVPAGPFTVQVTSVCVKRRGRWQFVAAHESFLRPNR